MAMSLTLYQRLVLKALAGILDLMTDGRSDLSTELHRAWKAGVIHGVEVPPRA